MTYEKTARTGTARQRSSQRRETASLLVLWPAMTVIFGGIPLMVCFTLADGTQGVIENPWQTIQAIGSWAEPAFENGYDALVIFATLLLAIAATTGFTGDWSHLQGRLRSLVSAMSILAMLILLAIAILTIPVLASAPEKSSRTILLWASAWAVVLVALTISEVLPLRQRVIRTRLIHVQAIGRAAKMHPPVAQQRGRGIRMILMVFASPIVIWAVFCGVVASTDPYGPQVFPLYLVTLYGAYTSLFGWTVRADVAQGPLRRFVGSVIIVAGSLISSLFGFVTAPLSPSICGGLFVIAVASLLLALPDRQIRRIRPLREISDWRTERSLKRLRAASDRVQQQWLVVSRVPDTPRNRHLIHRIWTAIRE